MTALRSTATLCILSAALASCGDDSPPAEPGPLPGPVAGPAVVRVTVTSNGLSPDADGYLVRLGDNAPQRIIASGVSVVSVPTGGQLAISLTDIALNCSQAPANPASVTAVADQVVEVALAFTCPATTGDLRVTVLGMPTGLGTSLVLDGTDNEHRLDDPNYRKVYLSRLAPGPHTLEVYSCTLAGANPAVATVTADLITEVTLSVSECSPFF